MKILIFCALREEGHSITCSLHLKASGQNSKIYQGSYSSHQIQLAITGMGRKNAQRACEQYVTDPRPDLVFSCGYAGGLDPRLKVGDVTLARRILLCEKSRDPIEILVGPSWENLGKVLEALTQEIYVGTHLTWMGVVDRAEKKKELGKRFGAMAVDMESGFIAKSLSPYAIPFFNLRVISDSCEENVEMDFSPWITQEGSIRKWPVFWAILKHPARIKYLWRVASSARKVREKLAGVLKRMIEQLPASPNPP